MLQLILQLGVPRRGPIGQLVSQQLNAAMQGLDRCRIADCSSPIVVYIVRKWYMESAAGCAVPCCATLYLEVAQLKNVGQLKLKP